MYEIDLNAAYEQNIKTFWPIWHNLRDLFGNAILSSRVNNIYTPDRFNNSGSALKVNSNYEANFEPIMSNGNLAISFWIKIAKYASQNLLEMTESGGSQKLLNLFLATDGHIHFKNKIIRSFEFTSKGKLEENKWHHIACIVTTSYVKLYIDGMLDYEKKSSFELVDNMVNKVGSRIGPSILNDPVRLFIFGSDENAYEIDEFKIFDRVLNEENISQQYEHQNISYIKKIFN